MSGAPGRFSTGARSAAAGRAFREAGRFDRAQVSVRAGVVAAAPVAAMLALGTAAGSPPAAVSMAVGAMLAGVAWRAGDGPLVPPLGTMLGASLALAATAFTGMLSGRWPWLHLLLLVLFGLIAGLAAGLGRRGAVAGTQSLIGFIVFGRFPEDLSQAAALTGLVLAGATAQIAFAAAVAVPLAWRRQRGALAQAYRTLAAFTDAADSSALPLAAALDAAAHAVDTPALFADPDRHALADLISEGRRIRLELIGFSALLEHVRRFEPQHAATARPTVGDALTRLRQLLGLTVAAIEGDPAALATLPGEAAELSEWGATREPLASVALDQRLAALIGQVTAAARLAAALHAPGPGRLPVTLGRPTRGSGRLGRHLAEDLERIRASANLDSAVGRHALRLAVVVALTELLIQRVALPRAYWAVVAASTVLRPSFGQTFTRGAERVLGTLLGVVLATLVAVGLNPTGWGIVAVVGALAWCTYAVFPASFTVGIAMLTGVIVFLLHAVAPGTVQTALDRGIDTAIGGAIGLLAYALWPTWSATSVGPLLANLVEAQREYLDAVLRGLIEGRRLAESQLRALARRARLVFADVDAVVGLARGEPHRDAIDPQETAATLSALRRVVWAVHAVRLDAVTVAEGRPLPELRELQATLDEALAVLAAALRDQPHGSLPRLRRLHRQLARERPALLSQALSAALDELVDAIDTAAATVGLVPP
ncbi:MAG TPA: FUSC family protein [Solirubrobacteraceae bacterium]|nr:FUSC family protein [Solirubrobacteraceae bacterium]